MEQERMPKNVVGDLCTFIEVKELITKKRNGKVKDFCVIEPLRHICALLNSEGGSLQLTFSKTLQENISESDLNDFIRAIEQQVYEITDYATVNKMVIHVCFPRHVVFNIKRSNHLCTVNYNLCISTETQVISLPTTEPVSSIREIIENREVPEHFVQYGTHCKYLIWKHYVSPQIRESKTVQLKMLKAEPSKCVSLADRITSRSNKLVNQVSAFANHEGGHIYIGVDSTYLVEGVVVNEPEVYKIQTKVAKTLRKMIWPVIPQKGKQWDIHFEPVTENELGHPKRDTYVIVIYIAPCPGGVFIDEPESYHVVDGQIRRMSLKVWRNKLLSNENSPARLHEIISPRRAFNMEEPTAERKHMNLSEYLQRLRKEGDWKAFDSFTTKALALQNNAVIPLVSYQKTLAAHMKKEYEKASEGLKEFQKSKEYATNLSSFKVQGIYLNAVINRSQGLHRKSYDLAQEGLNEAQSLQDGLTTAWFYTLIASLAGIRASEEIVLKEKFIQEAEEFNDKALRITEKLFATPTALTDLRQTIYINMALLALDSSIKGLNEHGRFTTVDRIQDAQEYLTSAQRPYIGAGAVAEYNMCMIMLAQSDFHYRLSQNYPEFSVVHLKSAFTVATKARGLARANQFFELLDYSMTRLAFLTEKLLRQRLNGGKKVAEQDYILHELTLEKT